MADEQPKNLPAETSADTTRAMRGSFGNDVMTGLGGLTAFRQVALLLGLAISVAAGVGIALWSQGGNYQPLYGSLESLDSSQVLNVLDTNQIGYKIDPNSGALLVESNRIHEARIKLAEAGMPGDRVMGFELLDKEQPLGSSQFMETTRYRRGLEGELARTISSISSIRSARVHLAIPEPTVFVRDQRKPRASVFLELYSGRSITPSQVQAIGNLVVTSIPELALADISIVDQKGNLLSNFEENEKAQAADKQFEYTRKVEDDLVKRINRILEPVVGAGKFKAEVSAEIDFTQVEQTDELYNPDLPAIRSEQTLQEQRGAGETAGGVPGALSNQPPGEATLSTTAPVEGGGAQGASAASAAEAGPSRSQATRNYELDRTLSYTRHQVGNVRRLTVAVVIDDQHAAGAEQGKQEEGGNQATTRWSDNDLARLAVLVRDAVGYDAARGDSVNVINSAFVVEEVPLLEPVEEAFWEQSWFMDAIKIAGGVITVLVLILGVLRPVMKNLSNSANQIRAFQERQQRLDVERQRQYGGADSSPSYGEDQVTLSGGDGTRLLPRPNQPYRNQMNTVRGMVNEDSGRVAQVVKRWVTEGE